MSLRWPDINLQGGEIIIRAENAMSKKHRVLPIYGEMNDALKHQETERDEKYAGLEWVFHDGGGQRLRTFYKAWRSVCDRAKLDGQLFHDLRRSAVRNMVRAGIPEKIAMAISGHRTRHGGCADDAISGRSKYFEVAARNAERLKRWLHKPFERYRCTLCPVFTSVHVTCTI